jgi:hypothetical protein
LSDATDWRCARCGKQQPLIVDTPCTCGCWWLCAEIALNDRNVTQHMQRHVGGPNWPEKAP